MPTGEVIDVVIVDDHHAIRSGMTALLADDQRLRVTGTAARIAELRTSGLSYEACILELAGVGEAKEIADLIGEVPAVVCTAAEHWRYRVTAWTCGAKGVLGKNTGAVPLADAVWHAVHRPHNIQAQLARAMLDAIENCGIEIPEYLGDVFDQVTKGRKVPRALAMLEITEEAYAADLERLRDSLRRAGFGVLQVPDLSGAVSPAIGSDFEPGILPPDAIGLSSREREVLDLYASGYSYEEIAEKLFISRFTVKAHVLKAMEKSDIPDGHADIRLMFAIYMSGLHRRPELLRRRLDLVRTQSPKGGSRPR